MLSSFSELALFNSTSVHYTREYLIKQMTPIKQPNTPDQLQNGDRHLKHFDDAFEILYLAKVSLP